MSYIFELKCWIFLVLSNQKYWQTSFFVTNQIHWLIHIFLIGRILYNIANTRRLSIFRDSNSVFCSEFINIIYRFSCTRMKSYLYLQGTQKFDVILKLAYLGSTISLAQQLWVHCFNVLNPMFFLYKIGKLSSSRGGEIVQWNTAV